MAAKAWEIVEPPDGMCIDATPADRLRAAEQLVPGTRDSSCGTCDTCLRTWRDKLISRRCRRVSARRWRGR